MAPASRLLQAHRLVARCSRGALSPGCWPSVHTAHGLLLCHIHHPHIGTQVQPMQRLQQQHQLSPFQGFAAHYAKGKAKGAKGGKGKSTTAAVEIAMEESVPDGDDELDYDHEPFQQLMQQAVDHLVHELAGIRTGRANPGLIENLLVDAAGDHIPVKACGTVTVRNPQLLAVTLFDPSLCKAVEKAIRDSPLSLNPSSEGAEVLVKLPRMTQDTIEKMVKLVHMEAEQAHQGIRRARQKAMDAIKKAYKSASADDKRRTEKELQKLHDEYSAEVDRLKKNKDTELRQHKN